MDEEREIRQSFLSWAYNALGPMYLVLLLLAGFTSFVLALVVVTRGRGGMSSTALLFIIPIPFLIGIFAAFHGATNVLLLIANSGAAPKASEIALGISLSLLAPLFGMLLMVPRNAVAVLGSLARSFPAESNRAHEK